MIVVGCSIFSICFGSSPNPTIHKQQRHNHHKQYSSLIMQAKDDDESGYSLQNGTYCMVST